MTERTRPAPPPLAAVPGLDAIAETPELARALPKHVRADLGFRAVRVLAALQIADAEPVPATADELLDVSEAAKMLGLGVQTLYSRARRPPVRGVARRDRDASPVVLPPADRGISGPGAPVSGCVPLTRRLPQEARSRRGALPWHCP